jgi:hypothetical protein
MLSAILAVFSSGGFGSLIGLVGGYFNRKVDLEAKKLEYKDKEDERNHEVTMLTAQKEYMVEEAKAKLQVATVESEAQVETAGYGAMAASYNFAKTTPADGWVDKASKIVRPLLTLLLFGLTMYILYQINDLVWAMEGIKSDPAFRGQLTDIWVEMIKWVSFQTGVCVGWWFAMRPGKTTPSSARN